MLNATIRPAVPADLEPINAIYNHYVLNSTATFHTDAVTTDERVTWWRTHDGRFPVLVAELDQQVVGWASLSPYIGRCAYRFTVENSIYLQPVVHRHGLGRSLLGALLQRGREAGFHSVIALVCAESEPSLRLHAALGFREVGRLVQVGHKFGRWLDTVIMQRML